MFEKYLVIKEDKPGSSEIFTIYNMYYSKLGAVSVGCKIVPRKYMVSLLNQSRQKQIRFQIHMTYPGLQIGITNADR